MASSTTDQEARVQEGPRRRLHPTVSPKPNTIHQLSQQLEKQAATSRHRRMLVLHGSPQRTREAAAQVIATLDPDGETILVSETSNPLLPSNHVATQNADTLLGTTHPALVFDAHERFDPNALGQTLGTVKAGGLFLLLAPSLDTWSHQRDAFDAHLAPPPYDVDDVTARFRTRFIRTLKQHEGIAIVNADTGNIEDDGHLGEPNPRDQAPTKPPPNARFPEAAYTACRTQDQAKSLNALETLRNDETIIVLEAHRGRGKSSAAGLAAGSLLTDEHSLLVTAPRFSHAREIFARARELLEALNVSFQEGADGHTLTTDAGPTLTYTPPGSIDQALLEKADAILVDEAASLPVHQLDTLLQPRTPIAFTTTIHGYEGAGRGFSLRLKPRLEATDRPLTHRTLTSPIRYAPNDPVERFSFRALLLDATPAVDSLLDEAHPDTVQYKKLDRDKLLNDEPLLREAFGLLVQAHYQTTPRDLARILDAPNLSLHLLTHEGHVASIAVLAREGNLPPSVHETIEAGKRIQGNLIPGLVGSQLVHPDVAALSGARIVRIATHPAARSRGLGSLLLDKIHEDAFNELDWFGTAFGGTPGLVRFWSENEYGAIHLSTTRNPASGEHSVLMLRSTSAAGRDLHARLAAWFLDRIRGVLPDSLRSLGPDIVRAVLGSVDDSAAERALGDGLRGCEARLVEAAATGRGSYEVDPDPFQRLAVVHLVKQQIDVDPVVEAVLVQKVLQGWPWAAVAGSFEGGSRRMVGQALGGAFSQLRDAYLD